MPAGFSDTDRESLQVQVDLLRRATPSRRLQLAFSLSADVMSLALAGIRRREPGATPARAGVVFVATQYGPELASAVRARIEDERLP
ncbi:MAG TPA: hypothetical protein PLE61_06740 [Vicinamibacterales bacterium]|nr:hypothetical protein [Vicinamibacterales bacterium]HPW20495.1 hypothetical protein [Vicinamibacterales bacterium]